MQCANRYTIVLFQIRWNNFYKNNTIMKNRSWNMSSKKNISTSCVLNEFHEYDKRSGYDTGFEIANTRLERIRLSLKQLKKEINLWKSEIKEVLECDPIFEYRAGDYKNIILLASDFSIYLKN